MGNKGRKLPINKVESEFPFYGDLPKTRLSKNKIVAYIKWYRIVVTITPTLKIPSRKSNLLIMEDQIDFIPRNRARQNGSYSSYLLSLKLSSKTQKSALKNLLFRSIDYPPTSDVKARKVIKRKVEEDIDNYLHTKKVVVLDDGDVCSICLQDLASGNDDGYARFLSCSHTFHPTCNRKWRNRKTNCPLCRHDMLEEQVKRRGQSDN
ncbi:hypothetical protein MKX03_009561 [Papaver bracteatum]|nr:hypothetical protein MKX03_009561 [Papaver bracteatum]